MRYDEPGDALDAWREGRTGFPVVDAGMRQLRATGWMHNRVRMIVASFLVKDLHLEWQHGARHFMRWLVDGDLASNQHGWQWVAGCGTDAAPYFRVFNPVTQGAKFDPDGVYVRRWVPELRGRRRRSTSTSPGRPPTGRPKGYPEPIVDHKAERVEALDPLRRDQRMSSRSVVIPARFNGPARSGNGGFVSAGAGRVVPGADGRTVEVTLRRPPPLDGGADELVAEPARPSTASRAGTTAARWRPPGWSRTASTPVGEVPPDVAADAMLRYPGLGRHPFPTCFACGPDRAEGDGLRIFPGPVGGDRGHVASLWVPQPAHAESSDLVDGVQRCGLATTWAALDCVGGWSEDLRGPADACWAG